MNGLLSLMLKGTLSALVTAVCAPCVAANTVECLPPNGTPTPAELVARAQKGPSLLFTREAIPAVKARIAGDADAAAWFRRFCADLAARRTKNPEVYDRGGQWTMWLNCRKCATRLKSESPTRHVCPGCGEVHSGWPYDDAYISRVNNANGWEIRDCGVAWLLTGERSYADRARDILMAYARVYGGYAWHQRNGPEKPGHNSAARAYAQVLDEAVWLCDVLDGYDAVKDALTEDERTAICEKLLRPSTATVRSECCYWSNHEVWHLAAFGRAGLVLGDASLVDAALHGKYGALNQLKNGILADGTWYEGSMHYHFYTMRAFAPFFRVLHNLGYAVPEDFRRMFHGPIAQVAPDGMMPPVNDSCSLEYLRPGDLPEYYELANAWWRDPVFDWWVRQQPRQSMAYALWGRSDASPAATPPAPASQICDGSGLAVLRSRTPGRQGGWIPDNCLMLDYGPHGEWHGHPDKLNIFFWLHGELVAEDPGGINFGSARHWGWYKSTLAHNEVRVDGVNQSMGEGELVAFVTNANASAVAAFCSGARAQKNYWDGPIYKGVDMLRATALVGDVVLDYFEVNSEAEHDYEWCFHARGDLTPPAGTELKPMTGLPPPFDMKSYDCPPLLKGSESWAWVENPRQGAVGETWHVAWTRPGATLGLWQRVSRPGVFATGVGSALPPPAKLTLAVNKVRGKRAVFATVFVPDAAAKVEVGDPFVRTDGARGFEATVNGSKHRLAVRREGSVRLDVQ